LRSGICRAVPALPEKGLIGQCYAAKGYLGTTPTD
jgi:hypothetical protein